MLPNENPYQKDATVLNMVTNQLALLSAGPELGHCGHQSVSLFPK